MKAPWAPQPLSRLSQEILQHLCFKGVADAEDFLSGEDSGSRLSPLFLLWLSDIRWMPWRQMCVDGPLAVHCLTWISVFTGALLGRQEAGLVHGPSAWRLRLKTHSQISDLLHPTAHVFLTWSSHQEYHTWARVRPVAGAALDMGHWGTDALCSEIDRQTLAPVAALRRSSRETPFPFSEVQFPSQKRKAQTDCAVLFSRAKLADVKSRALLPHLPGACCLK